MFIAAQIVGGTVHKRTNVSFANTKLLGVSEEVVWILLDFCYRSILFKVSHTKKNKKLIFFCDILMLNMFTFDLKKKNSFKSIFNCINITYFVMSLLQLMHQIREIMETNITLNNFIIIIRCV